MGGLNGENLFSGFTLPVPKAAASTLRHGGRGGGALRKSVFYIKAPIRSKGAVDAFAHFLPSVNEGTHACQRILPALFALFTLAGGQPVCVSKTENHSKIHRRQVWKAKNSARKAV